MTTYLDLDVLDGGGLRSDHVVRIENGKIADLRPRRADDRGTSLAKGGHRALICPGFIDLQVNGGGGLMLDACDTVASVSHLAEAHRAGGTLALLPTLITDTPATTARIIDLVAQAARQDPAIVGLHLEGPHLGVAGAHDPALLRPMSDADLEVYLGAAAGLPNLMITLAPEQVSASQISALVQADVVVSLGHSACSYAAAHAAYDAGASAATHLFNAMSGLHHREPGMVGAALDHARWIGLIADGEHVHPAALRLALTARPDAIYLVTDAMAVAGTDDRGFTLSGKAITRAGGRLTTAEGTLAGADITMMDAVRNLAAFTGRALADILPLAFDAPHRVLRGDPLHLSQGRPARLLHIHEDQVIATLTGDDWRPV